MATKQFIFESDEERDEALHAGYQEGPFSEFVWGESCQAYVDEWGIGIGSFRTYQGHEAPHFRSPIVAFAEAGIEDAYGYVFPTTVYLLADGSVMLHSAYLGEPELPEGYEIPAKVKAAARKLAKACLARFGEEGPSDTGLNGYCRCEEE